MKILDDDLRTRDRLLSRLHNDHAALVAATKHYNRVVQQAFVQYLVAHEAFDATRIAVYEFASDVAGDLEFWFRVSDPACQRGDDGVATLHLRTAWQAFCDDKRAEDDDRPEPPRQLPAPNASLYDDLARLPTTSATT